MMKLLDDLYIGIPSQLRIENCVIGKNWVTVRANGNVGMARMLEEPRHRGEEYGGKWLRDIGGHLYWHDLTEAAVGMAAINAWNNTPERIADLEAAKAPDYADCEGKKTAAVGLCPLLEKSGQVKDCFSLPMSPDFCREEYAGLKDYDVVVISADALTTRALPVLLEIIGEEGYVIVDGVSAPASACLFAFDMPVKKINGYYRRFDYTMEDAARLDLDYVDPGVLPFSVEPVKIPYIHEQDRLKKFENSPYQASAFNNSFGSSWQGEDYDRSSWSPIFKG